MMTDACYSTWIHRDLEIALAYFAPEVLHDSVFNDKKFADKRKKRARKREIKKIMENIRNKPEYSVFFLYF